MEGAGPARSDVTRKPISAAADPVVTALRTFTPKQVAELIGATEWWLRDKAGAREIPHRSQPLASITAAICSASTREAYVRDVCSRVARSRNSTAYLTEPSV